MGKNTGSDALEAAVSKHTKELQALSAANDKQVGHAHGSVQRQRWGDVGALLGLVQDQAGLRQSVNAPSSFNRCKLPMICRWDRLTGFIDACEGQCECPVGLGRFTGWVRAEAVS